jgi:hypothetical protein
MKITHRMLQSVGRETRYYRSTGMDSFDAAQLCATVFTALFDLSPTQGTIVFRASRITSDIIDDQTH